jgi:hypothetical protein
VLIRSVTFDAKALMTGRPGVPAVLPACSDGGAAEWMGKLRRPALRGRWKATAAGGDVDLTVPYRET